MLSNESVLTVGGPGDGAVPGCRPVLYGQQKKPAHMDGQERRSRRAWFSRSSSSAFINFSTSVQVRTPRTPPRRARPVGLIIAAVRSITQRILVLNWLQIGHNYTDFTRPSLSHLWAVCPIYGREVLVWVSIGQQTGRDSRRSGPCCREVSDPVRFPSRSSTDVHPPSPRFSLCSSPLAPSGSNRPTPTHRHSLLQIADWTK